jgi:hypothetical protein
MQGGGGIKMENAIAKSKTVLLAQEKLLESLYKL